VLTDCDRDVLLFVCQQDVAACHEGYRSCFFRELSADRKQWNVIAQKVFDPSAVYEKK
jgi:phosphoribosyl-AMP cyclohydrolase